MEQMRESCITLTSVHTVQTKLTVKYDYIRVNALYTIRKPNCLQQDHYQNALLQVSLHANLHCLNMLFITYSSFEVSSTVLT
jgi:hypothetical protein